MQFIQRWAGRPGVGAVGALLFAVAAAGVGSRAVLVALWHHRSPAPATLGYAHALLAVDYLRDGFARRGLNGTIGTLLAAVDGLDKFTSIHLFAAFFAALPCGILLAWLARKDPARALWLAIVVAFSPQTFRGWAQDFAHGDAMVMGFVGSSAVIAALGFVRWATVPLALGILSHDATVFYGTPLLLAIAWNGRRDAGALRPLAVVVALVLAEWGALVLLQHAFTASPGAMARSVLASGAHDPDRALAAYFTVADAGSILTWQCTMWSTAVPLVSIPAAYLVVGAYALVLMPTDARMAALIAVVALVPMTAMFVLAIDYGRYAMMATANACLMALVLHLRSDGPVDQRVAAAAALAFAALLWGKAAQPWYPAGSLARLVDRSVPDDMAGRFIQACDPSWLRRVREAARQP